MRDWLPTPAFSRAVMVGVVGVAAAVLLGSPVVMVLSGPLVLFGCLALLHRPRSSPVVSATLDHRSLHEGQGTRSRLTIHHGEGVEQVTRVLDRAPYVASRPADGVVAGLLEQGSLVVEISPRRWGRRVLGDELVALTSAWAGYRWGPIELIGDQMRVLPLTATFGSRAQTPRPVGLVGGHRSQRLGAGSEFADIRPFHSGDRLRRINWRVSVRTGELHVTTSPAEQDSGVLLVVDALADHGHSGGIGGAASSLDLSVRAASALAEHHVRAGDRVGLRVVGGDGGFVGYGAGGRHLRQVFDTLAVIRPRDLPEAISHQISLRVQGGSMVLVFSPMLSPAIVTATASLVQRGLAVVLVDTLPPDVRLDAPEGVSPQVAELAWRMRLIEREQVLSGLAALGCPVVAWRGPGTLDDVLRRLARRGPARAAR